MPLSADTATTQGGRAPFSIRAPDAARYVPTWCTHTCYWPWATLGHVIIIIIMHGWCALNENRCTVEPRYYVPRLQRFHPYNVQIPKSRISVMHYIFYRYRLQRTPLQRNFRYNVQISRKNMKNVHRYNVQIGEVPRCT